MNTQVFNEAQMELLKMFSYADNPQILSDLKQAVSDFFAKKAQQEIDSLWESGELNQTKVDSFENLHERTPYK